MRQKCERLLLHLFCSGLSSNVEEPRPPSVSVGAQQPSEEMFTGLVSHGVTVTAILMMWNHQKKKKMNEWMNIMMQNQYRDILDFHVVVQERKKKENEFD